MKTTIKKFLDRAFMKLKHEGLRIKNGIEPWHYGVTEQKRDPQLIVSLTSYPQRIPEIDPCLKSIANQNMKADRIILWLGNDTSAEAAEELKKKYASRGIEIRRDAENNFLSHKKYYYAMANFPKDIIVTADDDFIYPSDWLSSLYQSYLENPECISARRVHSITWDGRGNPRRYLEWKGEAKVCEPSHNLVANSGAGALFPPGCLCKEVLNHEVFMKKAKTVDDLWLKIIAILSDVKVIWVKNTMLLPTTINLHEEQSLMKVNVEGGENDRAFQELCKYYHLREKDFS